MKIKSFLSKTIGKIVSPIKSLADKRASRQKTNLIIKQNNLDKKLVFSFNKSSIPSLKQLNYLPSLLSKKEKVFIKILILVLVTSLVTLGVRIYKRHVRLVPDYGGHYVEGLLGSPQFLNPILAPTNDTDMDISRFIFSGLLKNTSQQELIPDLATDYEISKDQKEYTFHLRQDVKWHDGEEFNADDVIFTVRSTQDPEFKSPLEVSFKGVNVKKIDDYTVKFSLPEPFTPFISSLTTGILPEHIWINVNPTSAALADYNIKPIGTGPFEFEQLTKDKYGNIKSYTVTRNENFYGSSPYLEKITFKFFPDFTSLIEAAKNKNIEGISFIPQEFKDEVADKNKDLNYHSLNLPQYTAVFLNQKNNLLKDVEVAKSLAYAIDRQKIIDEVLNGDGEKTDGPILPGYVGYNPDIKKYDFNPGEAKKILDDNKWALLEGEEVRKKGDKELRFTLTTVNQPEFVRTAEYIQEDWRKIGIITELQIIESNKIQKDIINPRDFEVLLFGEIIGSDPDPYPFWHSSQGLAPGLNLSVYVNHKVDQLLEEARKTNDLEQRRLKYLHFQNILVEDMPAVFLYHPSFTYGVNKKIKGIESKYISIPSDRFADVETWFDKTRRDWQ